ncbi:MAG: 23S rRNA (uracil(1939)-C(5))-methyltransferase RlmD [Ruminococcaceae bacterium]|nr:23S rRNA (uracil(1939)-C(5))-methyltransferase RlmD [Oscillospiraceae bacterium]
MLKKNDVFTVTVEDMNFLGFGVAKIDGIAVFINGAVAFDVAKIKIIKTAKTYAVARVEEIVSPSPQRTNDNCKVSAACGGCAFRSVSYAYEKELKENFVKMSFIKQGLRDVKVAPLTHAKLSGYRNKGQYPVRKDANGKTVIGFFAAKSHRVLDCASCDLQNAAFAPIIEEIRTFIDENSISVYNEETNSGLVRHIYLRIGEKTGEIMLCMVLCGEKMPCEAEFVTRITNKFPAIKSLYINTNKKETNVVLGDKYRLLYGKEYITDILCGVKLMITPQSFYQVNRDAAEMLYQKAASLANFKGDELLLDLYCGIGSIGLSMADKVKKLIGIEVVPSAIECAKKNAAENGINNASFYCGDAADTEKMLDGAKAAEGDFIPDVVVFDPPRKGCSEELLDYISRLGVKNIVYISCNSETLARDVKILTEKGYKMSEVYPFDLFPRTGHCECVVRIYRT